jgi:hypothetical protein
MSISSMVLDIARYILLASYTSISVSYQLELWPAFFFILVDHKNKYTMFNLTAKVRLPNPDHMDKYLTFTNKR